MTIVPSFVVPSPSPVVALPHFSREWTIAIVEASARARGSTAEGRILALFDVLGDAIARPDRDARAFVHLMVGITTARTAEGAGDVFLAASYDLIRRLVGEAKMRNMEDVITSFQLLIAGAIVMGGAGDTAAVLQAQQMAGRLLITHRPFQVLDGQAARRAEGHSDRHADGLDDWAGHVVMDMDEGPARISTAAHPFTTADIADGETMWLLGDFADDTSYNFDDDDTTARDASGRGPAHDSAAPPRRLVRVRDAEEMYLDALEWGLD